MPTKYALQALLAVSESFMGQYVRTLDLELVAIDQGDQFCTDRWPGYCNQESVTYIRVLKFAEENRRMRISGEHADAIRKSIKNMPNITKLEFIDGRDGQCNRKHASYGERYMCRIYEGVARCKKIP